jgi:hypothetical protein
MVFSVYPPAPPLSQYPAEPPPPPRTLTTTLVHPLGLDQVYDPAEVYEEIDSNDPASLLESNFVVCVVPSENDIPEDPNVTDMIFYLYA